MPLRDQFLEQLVPSFHWTNLSQERFLLTSYMGQPIAVTLHLPEELFERYVLWIARTSEHGNVTDALGLIYVHLEEDVAVDSADGVVTDIGLQKRRLGHPQWVVHRIPQIAHDKTASVWVPNPPL